MKRILSIALAITVLLLSALAFVGCGEEGDGTRKKIGLTFYVPEDFTESNYEGVDIAYTKIHIDENGQRQGIEAEFTVSAMSYQELEEATYNNMPDPWPTNVEDYIRDLVIKNGFSLKDYTYDKERNVGELKVDFEYPADAGDMPDEYLHFVAMDNGEAIYLITYSCKKTFKEQYVPLFDEWASNLTLDYVG